jgi:hypothetical protein
MIRVLIKIRKGVLALALARFWTPFDASCDSIEPSTVNMRFALPPTASELLIHGPQ